MILPSKPITLKNGKKINLRTLKPFEALPLLEHIFQTHTEAYQNMNRRPEFWQAFPVPEEEKILQSFQDSNSKFMMGALHDEKIIGGLGFYGSEAEFIERTATIGMSIQKAYCNSGLGTAMMKYMIEQAQLYGFHRIELSVRTYNTAGIALYEKLGFKKIGVRTETAFVDNKYVDEYYYELVFK